MIEKRQTILIVDDESMNFAILSKIFKDKQKYRVLVAKSGEQALKIVQQDIIDLILLDILMPGMDGYETLTELKNMECSKDIPVVFVTSKNENQDEAKGLQLGAVDYIKKPFYLPIVEARVQTHLELKLKNEILTELVSLDGLTNIFNRRKFDNTLSQEWKRALRANESLTLLIIDVDHFKLYNDNYGHAAGDACLRKVASTLSTCLRRPADFLARYGGEEFAMILPDTDLQGGVYMADRVNHYIKGLRIAHDFSLTSRYVTVSVGGVTARPKCQSIGVEDLIQKADQQLYLAKESGRNMYKLQVL